LREPLEAAYIRLENDDGISGFIVSPRFEGMSAFDRQALIEQTLSNGPSPLNKEERRQVLMIAGLTPVEYDAVGAHIRVEKIKELGGGAVDILLHGSWSDAEYVRGALNNQKGICTTEPKQVSGVLGTLMSFRAKGTDAQPLTKAKVIRVLKRDPYIEVMANASQEVGHS